MAAARAPEGAEIVERWKGRDLVGWHYQRPFTFLTAAEDGGDPWRVVEADFVSTEDGSGIVHLAPAFGEDDFQVARREGLPMLNPVDADGAFDRTVPAWAGQFVKDADAVDRRRPTQPRSARARTALRAQLPALLALWHAVDLLGQDVVVRANVRTTSVAAPRERAHQLATAEHQARSFRQLAREQRRLGLVPRSVLGHPSADLAVYGLR